MIVDDSLTVRMDLEQAFAEAGYAPVLCGDLKRARLALENGPFALAVLDVLLPDGDGIDYLQELKQNPATAGLPVLILSTEAEVKDRIRGLSIGRRRFCRQALRPRLHASSGHTSFCPLIPQRRQPQSAAGPGDR